MSETKKRTKAEAIAELATLVRSDQVADPIVCVNAAAAIERATFGNRGKDWLELIPRIPEDEATLREAAEDPIGWAAAIVLRMPLGAPAGVKIRRAPSA
jgi:hypothetical protein